MKKIAKVSSAKKSVATKKPVMKKAQNGKGVMKKEDDGRVWYNSALNAPALDQMVKNQDKPLSQKGSYPRKPAPKTGGIIKSTVTTKKSNKKAQVGTTENRLNKDQKQGLFNQTLVQGGSKNPAFNPEKYYPSMYGKGRVGDKPAPKVKKSKSGSSIKKAIGKCKMGC
jgi:hypothetical protein